MRIRGERWRVTRRLPYDDVTVIEVAGADEANRGTKTGFLLPFEPIERLALSATPQVVHPSRWRRIARAALADATPSPSALRTAARADVTIIPFQLEPALAVSSGRGCRVLIADEVGLGKTVQAGLIVAEVCAREPDARTLVVCPAGLREQWQDELQSRFDLPAVVLDAAGIARMAAGQDSALNPWASARVIVTSIDYVKRPEVMRGLEPLVWDVIVFDEAHALAGPSDRATAAALLGARARRVVLLTATPHSGDDDAFRRVCDIGRLETDVPLMVFRRTRADAGIAGMRRTVTLRVRPTQAEAAMHEALLAYARRVWQQSSAAHPGARLAMAVLMRRAYSSAVSLAQSVERRRALLARTSLDGAQLALPFIDPDGDDAEPAAILGAPGLNDQGDEDRTLERLLALARRASATQSKVAVLVRLLRRVREPVLIFTEYRDTLSDLAGRLPLSVVSMHGGMTGLERRGAAREFTDGSAPVLLATDAASEGLNLHRRCRLIVNLELPWTPLRLEQRVGRVDRIGQSSTVHALHLVARGTAEESIVARLSGREARARASLEQIGEAVIRGTVSIESGSRPGRASEEPRVVTIDLAKEAEAEAERLRTARALIDKDFVMSSRPAMCVVRRRARLRWSRVWAWRLTFADEAGRLIWTSLLPVRADGARGPGTRAWARVCLDSHDPSLGALVEQVQDARLADLAARMRASVALLSRREQAILEALENRHGRLAATLLQPGLFDRRSERAANVQALLMDEARSRTAARLIVLRASGRPVVEERSLVFAVALQ